VEQEFSAALGAVDS